MPDDEVLSAEQQLAVVANSGGDLVAACAVYIAEMMTMNLAGALAAQEAP